MSTFVWRVFNLLLAAFWIVLGLSAAGAFFALGAVIYLAVMFLVELPEPAGEDEDA
jgi:hypothetical protein